MLCCQRDRLVGERGFEPPTPWSRTRCSTRLSHSPTSFPRSAHGNGTASREQSFYCDYNIRIIEAVESSQENHAGEPRAVPLGIHLEGPFISHTRRGVHPAQDLLPPTVQTFGRFWQAARGHIRIMTIAPELPGASEVISDAARRGVCVSLGHSNADLNSTRAAVTAGARHATHTFNAMRPLSHRDPGILAVVLTDSIVTADILAYVVHIDSYLVGMV